MTEFNFHCRVCGDVHTGKPALTADAPVWYYYVPESDRAARCELTSDTCIIDDTDFFIRSNIEIPVHGLAEPFQWGVWTTISRENFARYLDAYENADRTRLGPFFGWLAVDLFVYPDTINLETSSHLQAPPYRPLVEVVNPEHPLAIEQCEGISQERLAEIYQAYLHN